jgi:ABC-2 type transport system ATP-binding protein
VLIRKLSKGFRQRVGIAQAIVHDPPAIILDEPTVGLDPRQIIDVRNLIKSLAGEHTIILSTHILPEVSMTCSRVAIINRGRVVATNTPEQLMAQLAGGEGYELEVAGDPTQVDWQLRQLSSVRTVETVEQVADESLPNAHHRLRVALEPNSPDPGRDIAAVIVQSGLGLFEMRRIRVTLEDVFLELTTEEKPIESIESDEEDSASEPESRPESQPELETNTDTDIAPGTGEL